MRRIAWLICFVYVFKANCSSDQEKLSFKSTDNISVKELQSASNLLVKHIQKIASLKITKVKEAVRSNSSLQRLQPISYEGLIKVGGRLEMADIPYDAKHPSILPKNNKVTELIIQEAHSIEGHSGVNHVTATIRRTFWILGGKSYIKTVLSNVCYVRND